MKQIMYKIAGIGAICFAFALKGIAQDVDPVAPIPPVPLAETITIDSSDNQSEVIIRQKGNKDSKVTIEIRNGNFFVNGNPLEKFDDKNIEIVVKKGSYDDEPMLSITTSPFRGKAWDQERFQRDMQRNLGMQDMQRKGRQAYRNSLNEAFLGVSSRKTETGGATILEVTKTSPAEKAGLKRGDIITKVNEAKIESPENLFETIHQFKPGEKVKITFKREGKAQTVAAMLEKSKSEPEVFNYKYEYNMPDMPDMPNMPGLESPVWGPMPAKIGIKAQDSEEGKGVNVLEVAEGSPADKAGLKKGDVITNINGNEVNSANELIQQVRESRERSTVKVKILRNGNQQDMDIKIPRKLKTAEL